MVRMVKTISNGEIRTTILVMQGTLWSCITSQLNIATGHCSCITNGDFDPFSGRCSTGICGLGLWMTWRNSKVLKTVGLIVVIDVEHIDKCQDCTNPSMYPLESPWSLRTHNLQNPVNSVRWLYKTVTAMAAPSSRTPYSGFVRRGSFNHFGLASGELHRAAVVHLLLIEASHLQLILLALGKHLLPVPAPGQRPGQKPTDGNIRMKKNGR